MRRRRAPAPAVVPATPHSPACRDCGEPTTATHVPRLGAVARGLGRLVYGLTAAVWVGGLVVVLVARPTEQTLARRAKDRAAEALVAAKVPPAVLVEFNQTGDITREQVYALGEPLETRVRLILGTYGEAKSSTRQQRLELTIGAVEWFTDRAVIGLPLIAVGLLLATRRKVWLCPRCRTFIERA